MANGWLRPEAIKKRNFLNSSRQFCKSKAKGAASLQKCSHISTLNQDCNSSALRPIISKYNRLLGSIFVEFAFLPAAASLQMSTNSVSYSLPKAVPGTRPSCQGTERQHWTQTPASEREQRGNTWKRTQSGGNASVVNSREAEVGQRVEYETCLGEKCVHNAGHARGSPRHQWKNLHQAHAVTTEKDIAGAGPSWHWPGLGEAFSRARGKACILIYLFPEWIMNGQVWCSRKNLRFWEWQGAHQS